MLSLFNNVILLLLLFKFFFSLLFFFFHVLLLCLARLLCLALDRLTIIIIVISNIELGVPVLWWAGGEIGIGLKT